jgi:type IV pilus assembly protein PilN
MIRINLLPWREERRVKARQQFYVLLAVAAFLGAALVFAGKWYMDGEIEFQNDRNAHLQDAIDELDEQIAEIERLEQQRANLMARQEVIERLQRSRAQMVYLFDELVNTIPDGVYLREIVQQGQRLTLNGRAQSDSRVAAYMRQLEASEWMQGTRLGVVESTEASEEEDMKDFQVIIELTDPRASEDSGDEFGVSQP